MRGNETVRVTPKVEVDRLRGPIGTAADPYDLEGCIVVPRSSREEGKGIVGIEGFDVFYFGKLAAPPHTAEVEVRGETHEIADIPRDYIIRGRRKGLIFTTKRVF